MSVVYKGEIVESELSANSKGGTEMMRQRLVDSVDKELLEKAAVHLSRPRELYEDVPNILWCHDLAEDPENKILRDGGWSLFDWFVFVSAWQRDQYIVRYGIPYSKCSVIHNAVETEYKPKEKDMETVRFIYHTTPHRGLELLVPIFDALAKQFDNIQIRHHGGNNNDVVALCGDTFEDQIIRKINKNSKQVTATINLSQQEGSGIVGDIVFVGDNYNSDIIPAIELKLFPILL